MKKTPQASEPGNSAEALRRRRDDWAAGAEEGRALDRQIARQQSPQERLDAGRQLVELAAKLRREAEHSSSWPNVKLPRAPRPPVWGVRKR